jgi:hypothetical protein
MIGIETPDINSNIGPSIECYEMSRWQMIKNRFRGDWKRFRRKLPYLVWYGDELDVGVTLKDIAALGGDPKCAFEAQDMFNRMGISFDTGSGSHGRDWEWDWSLRGPISVQFRSRARNPERRVLETKPELKLVQRI